MGSQGGWGQSKEFLELVKSIGEARSKAEEDRIILREIETLKRRIAEPDVPWRKMKEYLIRLVYVEMLGHDTSFGYIHTVQMTHDDSLLKRTGFLTVTLFLNEDHDLIILIVNTIQKDLLLLLLFKEKGGGSHLLPLGDSGRFLHDGHSSLWIPRRPPAVTATAAPSPAGLPPRWPHPQQPRRLPSLVEPLQGGSPVQAASSHGGPCFSL